MQSKKKLIVVAVMFAAMVVVVSGFVAGCGRASAQGKLQVMFSGNIKGNIKPCGCHVSKGGVARLATFINRNHLPNANWLTVDAGNYVDRAGNTGGCTSKCAFMISSYQDLSYDVLNIGRSEVWMGLETIRALQDSARKGTEFVSANLVQKKSGKTVAKPYVVKDYGNMKVAILGLLNESDFIAPSTIDTSQLNVISYIETAKKYVPGLKRSCDAVVILADLSSQSIDTLVRAVSGIDLIISSGSVTSGETGTRIGKTRVIGTGTSGYNGHYTVMEFNPAWKDSLAFADSCIPLDSSFQEAGKWTDRLASFESITPPSASSSPTTKIQSMSTQSTQPLQQPTPKPVSPTARSANG